MNDSDSAFSTLSDVLGHFSRLCDSAPSPDHSSLAFSARLFLFVYSIGILLQLFIFSANARLAKSRSAFLILLHINVLDIVWLSEYCWLSVEFLSGFRLPVPLGIDAYLFRLVNFCIDSLYILLALNRFFAVFAPFSYQIAFNLRTTKKHIFGIWLMGIVYSVYTNWIPERRPFHCLAQLGYFEPMAELPKTLLAQLPDHFVYNLIQQLFMACICLPMMLYLITSLRLGYDFLIRKNSAISPTNETLPQNSREREQFANLMLERTQLFLISLLAQLPYFISYTLYHSSRIFDIDQDVIRVMALFWQLFGTIFHVQQPVLMLLLSRDLRQAMRDQWRWTVARLVKSLSSVPQSPSNSY